MKKTICIISTALWTATSAVAAIQPEQAPVADKSPGWQPAPANVTEWADRCTDSTVNGWGFKDPKNFVRLMETFSDPAIFLEFARRMEDPESYARIASRMLDPATAKNYLEWTDPVIFAKWSLALGDPNFYTATLRPLLDPSTYLRWLALPVDQRTWSVALNMLNPAVWLKWSTAPVNPKVLEPLVKAADVNNTLRWLQTAGDPANYKTWNVYLPQNGQVGVIPSTYPAPGSLNANPAVRLDTSTAPAQVQAAKFVNGAASRP